MKGRVVIVLAAVAVLGGVAVARFLYVADQAEFNEVVAYFDFPESSGKHEMIRLRITAKAPKPEMKSRIEEHRGEVRVLLVRAVLSEPGGSRVLRDSRRAVLKVLGLENKTKAVAIDVVPDLSAMPHNKKIRELLEKAHSVPDP